MCGVSSDGYLPPSGTIDLPLAHAIPELVPAYYCHKLAASKIPNEYSIISKNDSFYYTRKENEWTILTMLLFSDISMKLILSLHQIIFIKSNCIYDCRKI